MTRFARAKGSKASNEKVPEDSTPWEVMKEQLMRVKKENEEAKKRHEAENQRIENYENFLKERKVQKRKATWCDFPEAEQTNSEKEEAHKEPLKKKNKYKKNTAENIFKSGLTDNLCNDKELSKDIENKLNKKKKLSPTVSELQAENHIEVPKKKKNKKNKKKATQDTPNKDNCSNILNDDVIKQNQDNSEKYNKEVSLTNHESKFKKPVKKKAKTIDGKYARRKPINDRSFQLIINGKEVELVRFDGFPIMKKDAERLTELKESMVKKGIPKSEVQRTMKLERRRAEKALARLKRDVCYNCRKGGHNLSDCPDLKSKIPGVDAAEGVCFKCGSTEHMQFDCKVQKDKEFRFATCFICKEQGHIARQCPDNPKGLYPNGGCCKLCGDVTHLRKDCPMAVEKKEGSLLKLQTLDNNGNVEDIEQANVINIKEATLKKPKKIKF